MLPMTTVQLVKDLIEIKTDDAEHDTAIARLITYVSAQAQALLGRHVWIESRTEQLAVKPRQRSFQLVGYGHEDSEVKSVKNSWRRAWSSVSDKDETGYFFDPATGLLRFDSYLEAGFGALLVEYSGGMADGTVSFVAAYPDISGAIAQQVGHLWQRRGELGIQDVSFQGGTVAAGEEAARWLKMPKATILRYRRGQFGG